MLVVAIDGACRRNGKPDCVSAGGVFVQRYSEEELVSTHTISSYEVHSTNQRGEMLALVHALRTIYEAKDDAQIITDSEYLFNAMTKNWLTNWNIKGWITSTGEPVKNADLWQEINEVYKACIASNIDIIFYHIKGHVIPFGKVTANRLLCEDGTGYKLMSEAYAKYAEVSTTTKKSEVAKANRLSIKNNGFELPEKELCRFIVANVVVDAVATRCVEEVDALCNR